MNRLEVLWSIPVFLLLFVSACDRERAPAPVAMAGDTLIVSVLSTTDVHGWVMPWDYFTDQTDERYGLAKAATIIDSLRNRYAYTMLLDAGDWLQGNAMAEYFARVDTTAPYPFLTVVDALDYDAAVLGNHEFNFGIPLLNHRLAQTRTPIIGANVYDHGTRDPAFVPYIIREIEGVRIAVVGLTTPGSAVWDRPRVDGRLEFGDGAEAARRFVSEVQDLGADVVIILAHSGFEGASSYHEEDVSEENFGRSIAENVAGVDLLVLGHHHRVIEDRYVEGPDGRTVGVIMPGRWASHVGLAELEIIRDPETGVAQVVGMETRAIPVAHASPSRQIADLVREDHEAVRNYMNTPLATTTSEWSAERARAVDTPIVDLIQHVQMERTGAQLSAAAAFNTNASFGPGPITLGEITRIYPYENTLYVLEVTGEQVREFLEFSSLYYLPPENDRPPQPDSSRPGYNFDMLAGVDYVIDLSHPAGERVVELTYAGVPVQPDDRFTLAVNSYRAEGGGGFDMIAGARVVEVIDEPVRDMIADFLREEGEIEPGDVFVQNWRMEPAVE